MGGAVWGSREGKLGSGVGARRVRYGAWVYRSRKCGVLIAGVEEGGKQKEDGLGCMLSIKWGSENGGIRLEAEAVAAQTTLPRGSQIWQVLGSSMEVSGSSVKRNAWMPQVREVSQPRHICKESGSCHLSSEPQCFRCHAPSQSQLSKNQLITR